MALYIPTGRRRRTVVVAAALALVVGLSLGILVGRAMQTSVVDRVRTVQNDARDTAAGLRVIALHDQTNSTGNGGAELVLQRTRTELVGEFKDAVWLRQADKNAVLAALDQLVARTDRGTASFGDAAEALAKKIEDTFATG